jgi:two-component system sensor histidine kinase MprB
VSGQPSALERAVVNLLDNAVKFGPADQVVHVRAHTVVERTRPYAEVAVGDRAPVIPEGERERIFHRFHRLDSARPVPGSGLGLAIVYQTAAAHRGTVTVEPREGGGNLFRLRLPTG